MYRYNLPQKYQVLDGSVLKIIACITMLIDHSAVCLLLHLFLRQSAPFFHYSSRELVILYHVLRAIGRTAFPIYCFLLVEGFVHTTNRWKYALRLLIFGFISEIPFDLCIYYRFMYFKHNNVYFTLFIGLIALMTWDYFKNRWYIQLPAVALLAIAAKLLHTDYGWKGVVLIFILYMMHSFRVPQTVFGLLFMSYELPGVILGFIPMLFYSGKRGRQLKYFYYAFYPGHLALLYLLSVWLAGHL